MTRWFGTSWGAPVNDPDQWCPTPVGEACARCARPIEDNDQGFSLSYLAADDARFVAYHRECFLKSVISHDRWPVLGYTPEVGDGFEVEPDGVWVCPTCNMRWHPERGWL